MVARTVTDDEVRRSRGGQQTAERDDRTGQLLMKERGTNNTMNTTMQKKTKSKATTAFTSGLFHTVTASTPRAKRMARVYPHSSATGLVVRQAAPFRANGVNGLAPLQQQQQRSQQQHAGDHGEEEVGDAGDEAMATTWYTAAGGPLRDSMGSYQFDDSDCESELCLTLTPTRIARQNSNDSSYNAPTYQRQSSGCSDNGSTARRGSRATSATRNDSRANTTGHVQEDILLRIATLKALCDQGFITSDEYERRKSAIVDELTFSFSQGDGDDSDFGDENESDAEELGAGTLLATMMTATQPNNSRMPLGRSSEGLPLIVPHGPNFHDIKSETATKHVFDYTTRQWSSSQVHIALDETPFSKGSLRVVYHLLDLTDDEEGANESKRASRAPKRKNYVAKLAIDPDEDPQTYFRDTELQAHCAHYAQMYNSYNPPKRVEFIEAWVLELTER